MYKVFVNEKRLSFSQLPQNVEKTLHFEDLHTLEFAIDQLENTSCSELNIYHQNIDDVWEIFNKMLKKIEAAGGIVSNDDGDFLFIHRLGRWDLPKGKIEKGESLEEAAIREIEEETSLKNLSILNFINSTYHIYRERNGNAILKVTHWYRMKSEGYETPIPQTEEGITQATWKNEKDIMEEVLPTTFQNIKFILKEAGII